MLDASGKAIIRNGKKIIEGYDMFIPALNTETLWALCIMIAGILTIWIIEKTAGEK
jgi:hypothetical protein